MRFLWGWLGVFGLLFGVQGKQLEGCFVPYDLSIKEEFQTCGGNRYSGLPFATRSPVLGTNGAAATSQPLATQIALDILKAGGNAIDAAIAANAAQGLMEPTANGIGGDLFAIVWHEETKKIYGLNGSGRSARGQSYEQLIERLQGKEFIPELGPLPITVPGAVDGWFMLHERFGSKSMEEILKPTIQYARDGFPVTQYISQAWRSAVKDIFTPESQALITSNGLYPRAFDGFRQTFVFEDQSNPRGPNEGEIFRNTGLADTLQAIATQGRDVFYSGDIARKIDQWAQQDAGVPLRYDDFVQHRGEWVETINTTYRGVTVVELPPNGQGLAALQMLNILEGFDVSSFSHNSIELLHILIESKKLAYADRARYYADPAFVDVPVEHLISKEYAAERRKLIDMNKAAQQVDAGQLHKGDTIYLTVADKFGNMVSLIQSLYAGIGSAMAVPGLGFGFQDRGAAFNTNRSHPNAYEPGKRPFHTILPAFALKNQEPFLSFGVMGGDMQPQGHVQIVSNIVDFGMNVQEAGDAARWRHIMDSDPNGYLMTDGGKVQVERGICSDVRMGLEARQHTVISGGEYGGYQAIMREKLSSGQFVYRAASESRKDGMAAAY